MSVGHAGDDLPTSSLEESAVEAPGTSRPRHDSGASDDLAAWEVASDTPASPSAAGQPQRRQPGVPPLKWAHDRETGRIRHIQSLGPERSGANCGCICSFCGLPLTAVNAAALEYQITPHFRHPPGALKNECVVLAAREAALLALQSAGDIVLPRREVVGRAVGLSGHAYEVTLETPAHTMRVDAALLRDHATAVLTLEDGSELLVELTGRIEGTKRLSEMVAGTVEHDVHVPAAVISINLSDPVLATLDLEDLVGRLRLLPHASWCSHWDDVEMQQQATAEARQQAIDNFDLVDPRSTEALALEAGVRDEEPAQARRLLRESLLHLAVKEILSKTARLRLPALEVTCDHAVADEKGGTLQRIWMRPPEMAAIAHVRLEQRIKNIVPDVMATRVPAPDCPVDHLAPCELQLLIEVTVYNHIDAARLQRIEAVDLPTLEIDLSRLAGRITRQGLAELVVHDVDVKRWVHHPRRTVERQRLACELTAAAQPREAAYQARRVRMAQALNQPARHWAGVFLEAVRTHALQRTLLGAPGRAAGQDRSVLKQVMSEARDAALEAAEALWTHSVMPEDADDFFLARNCVLERLLSVRENRGIGCNARDALEVLQEVQQGLGPAPQWHAVVLMAARAYDVRSRLDREQAAWLDGWRHAVWRAVLAGDPQYLRPTVYDPLLALLFPELAPLLAHPAGKSTAAAAGRPAGRTPQQLHPSLLQGARRGYDFDGPVSAPNPNSAFRALPISSKWNGLYADLGLGPQNWPAVLNVASPQGASAIDAAPRLWQGDVFRHYMSRARGAAAPARMPDASTVAGWCIERHGLKTAANRSAATVEVANFLDHLVRAGHLQKQADGYRVLSSDLL